MKKLVALSLLLLSSVVTLKGMLYATPQPLGEVPFEMQNQHMFFKLKVKDSRSLNFIFDTGASMTVINPKTAKELSLESFGSMRIRGAGGMTNADRYQSISFVNGDIRCKVGAIGFSVTHLEKRIGQQIDGIIGADLLNRYVVQIDYDQKLLRFFDFDGYYYKGKGQKVKLTMWGRLATCPLTVKLPNGEKHTDDFLIDTGAGLCLGFTTLFSNNYKLTSKFSKKYRFYTSGATTIKTYLEAAKLPQLKLGNHTFQNIPVTISSTRQGVMGTYRNGGILGNRILKKFNITFNYRTRQSYWEPNRAYPKPFKQNCAGLMFSYEQNFQQIKVHQVIKNSAAAEAGLKKGDWIVKINGKQVQAKDIHWIRTQLGVPGNKVKLEIRRKKETKLVTLKLKSMI